MTAGHTAIVTGANHGIGAATATALAQRGCAVLCTFLRVDDQPRSRDPAGLPRPPGAGRHRRGSPNPGRGGRAAAVEADLSDPAMPARLFDTAENQFGPVDILVNNATGWLADSFAAATADRLGWSLQPVTAATWTRQFTVDAMAVALMIGEFARRHIARQATWGRIIGLTSGGDLGFPEEVSYGAAKAAQENYTMSAALELAPFGITAKPLPWNRPWLQQLLKPPAGNRCLHGLESTDCRQPRSGAASTAWQDTHPTHSPGPQPRRGGGAARP